MTTPEQLHILQHSLGCNKYGQSKHRGADEGDGCFGYYRNRFVTDPGSGDGVICGELVAQGLMKDRGAVEWCGGMHVYAVTKEGVEAMRRDSPPPPKLTRGQERYRRFLKSDSSLSFIEWLKRSRA